MNFEHSVHNSSVKLVIHVINMRLMITYENLTNKDRDGPETRQVAKQFNKITDKHTM